MVAEYPGALATAGIICQTITHVNSVFNSNKLQASQAGPAISDLVEDAIR